MMWLGCLASQFPELHETFIVRELAALREAGIGLRIYSLKPCRDRIVHPDARGLIGITRYLSWRDAGLWGAMAAECARHPLRAASVLGWAMRTHAWPPGDLVKALGVSLQAIGLARFMRRDGITHLHAHWATMPTTAAVAASRWLGIPFSFTAHAWDLFVANPSLEAKLRLARLVVTCTAFNQASLTQRVPEAAGKIVLNYHGVNVSRFAPQGQGARGEGRGNEQKPLPRVPCPVPLLLSVGRLVETKGYPTLIEAYRLLRRRGLEFQAVIVGDGPLRRRLRAAIDRAGLAGRVELRRAMPQEALQALYAEAFAFVLPCTVARNGDRDGIPNVVLEAMAMGLPVVSTAVSGLPEAVEDERSGLLVAPDAPVALADGLERLLNDPSWARTLGVQARERAASRFDEREHMRRLVGVMQGMLAGARGKGHGVGDIPPASPCPPPPAPRPTRVLYVIWSLAVGGAERVVSLLAQHLDRSRYDPVVACLNEPGQLGLALRALGIPVIALRKRSLIDLPMLWRLIRLIRRERIGLVHTHLWGGNVWGRLAASVAGVPVVISEHNTDSWKQPWHFIVDRCLEPGTAKVIAVSEAVQTFYIRHGLSPARCVVIPNGIEVERFAAPGRSTVYDTLGWDPGTAVFVAIGRLVPSKNHAVFVRAMARVIAAHPQARALIVGEGPQHEALTRQIEALGLSGRVVLAGLREDIPAILHGARAVVFTSEREGLPMVLLEAMAAGVPAVSTAVGGIPEAVDDGRTGWLLASADPDALAARLGALLADPARAQQAGAAAQQMVRARWSVEAMARAHEALYDRVLHPATQIVYVIDHLDIGGAQQQLLELIRHLPRDRFDCSVISLSRTRTRLLAPLGAAGARVELLDPSGRWSWRCFLRLWRCLRARRPQIVHTWLFTADLYGRVAARLAGVPRVVSSVRSIDAWKRRHHIWADRVLQHITDIITVNAEAIRAGLLERERIRPEKVRTIYNGVDLSVFAPDSVNGGVRQTLAPGSGPVVGILGRFMPEKDPLTFVRAMGRVARAVPEVRVLLVGDGPLREAMLEQARRLGLADRLTVAGFRADRAAFLQAMDVLVLASVYEGCANAILEAMAMAKPVVATRVGGNAELVSHGRTGLLVPQGDDAAMAEAVISLLKDPERARLMGRAGRSRAEERFTVERMVEQTAALYTHLVQAQERPR